MHERWSNQGTEASAILGTRRHSADSAEVLKRGEEDRDRVEETAMVQL